MDQGRREREVDPDACVADNEQHGEVLYRRRVVGQWSVASHRRYGDQVPLQHHTAASGVFDAPITVAPTDRDRAISPQRTATGHHQRFAPLSDDDAFSKLDAAVERAARAGNCRAIDEDKRTAVAIVDQLDS